MSKKDAADAGALINPHLEGFHSEAPPERDTLIDPITHLIMGAGEDAALAPTAAAASASAPTAAGQEPSAKILRATAVPLGQARHYPYLLPSDHTTHVYGIPSIRTDIHRPAKQGLADFQNYGDEFDCKVLMNHHLSRKKYLESKLAQMKKHAAEVATTATTV